MWGQYIKLFNSIYTIVKKWSWDVFDHAVEGGSSLNPTVLAHLSGLLNTGRVVGTKTFEVDDAFPIDDLWFGSDT